MLKQTLSLIFLILLIICGWFTFIGKDDDATTAALQNKSIQLEVGSRDVIFDSTQSQFLCAYENYLLTQVSKFKIPGYAVSIVDYNKPIYVNTHGYRNVETSEPITNSTIFRIGSVSKGFAAALAAMLVADSTISFTDPIHKYLPEYQINSDNPEDSITLENILSHTTGYPYQAFSTLIEDEVPLEDMIEELQKLKLSRRPGEIHSYQNVAYSLSQSIIERATNERFDSLMYKKIFDPLGMVNTSTTYHEISSKVNKALPHFPSKNGYYVGKISTSYYNALAAGGINASIKDMTLWLSAIMGHQPEVLSPEIRTQLFEPRVRTAVKNNSLSLLSRPRKGHYGLGWRIIEYPSDTIIYHEGYVNGYKSAIGFSKVTNMGICLLTNAGGRFSSVAIADFFRMAYSKKFSLLTNRPEDFSQDQKLQP